MKDEDDEALQELHLSSTDRRNAIFHCPGFRIYIIHIAVHSSSCLSSRARGGRPSLSLSLSHSLGFKRENALAAAATTRFVQSDDNFEFKDLLYGECLAKHPIVS